MEQEADSESRTYGNLRSQPWQITTDCTRNPPMPSTVDILVDTALEEQVPKSAISIERQSISVTDNHSPSLAIQMPNGNSVESV